MPERNIAPSPKRIQTLRKTSGAQESAWLTTGVVFLVAHRVFEASNGMVVREVFFDEAWERLAIYTLRQIAWPLLAIVSAAFVVSLLQTWSAISFLRIFGGGEKQMVKAFALQWDEGIRFVLTGVIILGVASSLIVEGALPTITYHKATAHKELGWLITLGRACLLRLGAAFTLLGIADFAYRIIKQRAQAMLTREEAKRESLEQHGHPQLKRAQKSSAHDPIS